VACFIKWSTHLKQTVRPLITSLTDDRTETVSETVDTNSIFVWLTIHEDFIALIAINFVTRVYLFLWTQLKCTMKVQ